MASPVHARADGTIADLPRKLAALFTFGVYTLTAPFSYLFLATLSFAWRRHPARRARRLQRLSTTAYRFMHDWLRLVRLVRFDHRRALQGLPPGACVVIANHPTLMDITSITASIGGGFTIVKPALFQRRLLRPLLVGAGHVEGPGRNPTDVHRVIDQAVQRIESGTSLIVFPEGTRSPAGGLLRFGRLAFEVACRARVRVVSVTISCEPLLLSKECSLLSTPKPVPELCLTILAVDDPATFGFDSRKMRRCAESRYRNWIDARHLVSPQTASVH